MRTPDIHIAAVGTYVPGSATVSEAVRDGLLDAGEAERSELLGVAVAGDTPAPEMAVRAVRQALERWGGDVSALGLLLYVDVYRSGPEGWLPQSYLMREAVGGELLAVGIRQGCNGVFGALELAVAHLRGAGSEAVLITAADNMNSPLVDRWQASPGYLLGDGSSAVVLTRSEGFARLLSVNSVAVPELEALHRGTRPLDPIGLAGNEPLDLGARQAEFRDGGEAVAELARTMTKAQSELLSRTLDEAGVSVADLARVAVPHGNRELVGYTMASFGLPLERSTWEFGRRVGHLMASDQLVAFDHLLSTGAVGPGDRVLLMGYGPGMGIAAAVIEITAVPPYKR